MPFKDLCKAYKTACVLFSCDICLLRQGSNLHLLMVEHLFIFRVTYLWHLKHFYLLEIHHCWTLAKLNQIWQRNWYNFIFPFKNWFSVQLKQLQYAILLLYILLEKTAIMKDSDLFFASVYITNCTIFSKFLLMSSLKMRLLVSTSCSRQAN